MAHIHPSVWECVSVCTGCKRVSFWDVLFMPSGHCFLFYGGFCTQPGWYMGSMRIPCSDDVAADSDGRKCCRLAEGFVEWPAVEQNRAHNKIYDVRFLSHLHIDFTSRTAITKYYVVLRWTTSARSIHALHFSGSISASACLSICISTCLCLSVSF